MDSACQTMEQDIQIPEPFVWTEDAHSLYISFLEDAFVNDLYLRHYCSVDICGCFPPDSSSVPAVGAESLSPVTPQHPSTSPPQYESEAKMGTKARRKCSRAASGKSNTAKRKGKWLSQDADMETKNFSGVINVYQGNTSFHQHAGSCSHSFQSFECAVPDRVPQVFPKRPCSRAKINRTGTLGSDQVVPTEYEQG
ncbi:hypothetical protein KP509_13G088400 [Ceratopteris richardii]|uniref:Uncharacterized protein n=1 Tax=Ceratopteris richardii TaxID=49495 RepID=A0A8T2TN97_CERRI|nr:hypothetical protein KP509_13G088400 [Ceratopteris richardii]